MSDAILTFLGVVTWMGMGGFAFSDFLRHADEDMKEMTFGIFLACLLLAPFLAAVVVSSRFRK